MNKLFKTRVKPVLLWFNTFFSLNALNFVSSLKVQAIAHYSEKGNKFLECIQSPFNKYNYCKGLSSWLS